MSWITTALYCPGNKPAWFEKALSGDADQVILDLEDSVPPSDKPQALEYISEFLASLGAQDLRRVQIRVNGSQEEIAALEPFAASISIRLPKVEDPSQLEPWMEFRTLVPLIESARGFQALNEIGANPKVEMLAMGELDLESELLTSDQQVMDYLRIQLVIASAACSLRPPMMSAWTRITDYEGLKIDCERGKGLGFVGRTAVHPSQLEVISEAFRSVQFDQSQDQQKALLIEGSGGVALDSEGNMLDAASLRRRNSRDF